MSRIVTVRTLAGAERGESIGMGRSAVRRGSWQFAPRGRVAVLAAAATLATAVSVAIAVAAPVDSEPTSTDRAELVATQGDPAATPSAVGLPADRAERDALPSVAGAPPAPPAPPDTQGTAATEPGTDDGAAGPTAAATATPAPQARSAEPEPEPRPAPPVADPSPTPTSTSTPEPEPAPAPPPEPDAQPAGPRSPEAARAWELLNSYRRDNGLPTLATAADAMSKAQAHAEHMAAEGRLSHSPSLFGGLDDGWTMVVENVGSGSSVDHAHSLFVADEPHRRNMLNADATAGGVGVAFGADGTVYVVQILVG